MKYVPLLLFTFSMQYPSVHMTYFMQDYSPQMLSTKFVPKVTLKMCLLKPNVGPCRGNLKMYYFVPEDKTCSTFNWGGCQGNGNRFDSKSECEQTCLTKPNEPKKRPRYCSLTFDYGFCFGAVKRWYYDKLWQVCKERIYSGCGGNKNNFYNKEQCESICRFSKGSLSGSKSINKDGVRKVVYVYTNGTKRSRPPTQYTRFTSPKPRYSSSHSDKDFTTAKYTNPSK